MLSSCEADAAIAIDTHLDSVKLYFSTSVDKTPGEEVDAILPLLLLLPSAKPMCPASFEAPASTASRVVVADAVLLAVSALSASADSDTGVGTVLDPTGWLPQIPSAVTMLRGVPAELLPAPA
jgi:hypothetical protein